MIEQRVRLSKRAHKAIAKAQRALNLARFEDALGYYVEGAMTFRSGKRVGERMFEGMQMLRKGGGR